MANEFIKLTAAALTMLSTEALADASKNQAPADLTQHAQVMILPEAGIVPTGLLPEDLIVDFNGRLRINVSSEPEVGGPTCNSPCPNSANCCGCGC